MAQTASPTTGQKRGPGRPPKDSAPALKKTRLSTSIRSPSPSTTHSPTNDTPKSVKLPHSLSAQRALPTTSEPQSPTLSDSDYQSIAESAVLHSSLDRSRQKWIHDGVFERYWTKPESGKNARPPPPNNPELKWQKQKGPCRIRIEPHIFEAEMYVEEKPKPAPVVKQQQYGMLPGGAYGHAYRPGGQQVYGVQAQQGQYYSQGRSLPPIQQPSVHGHAPSSGGALPPIPPMAQNQPSGMYRGPQSPAAASTPPAQQDKKPSPDPVISALATRAASDPELKALMKEVATGNATQDQLKVFQGHIDALTKAINDEKKKEEEAAAAAAQAAREKQQQSEKIQYDGANDNGSAQPPRHQPYQPQHPPYPPQQTWQPRPPPAPPAPPQPQPVILAFTTPGATEDRFLFPQHCILESLSPQHLLASFIVIRRGSQAADSTGLDPGKEYWQPVTCMVEVAYNREHLLECVKKWVKPASEVREWMEGVMKRCTRAPESHLVLRLPRKGTEMAAEPEEVLGSGGEEIQAALAEVKERKTVKYIKKADKGKEASGKAEAVANGVNKTVAAAGTVATAGNVPATTASASSTSAIGGEQKIDVPAGEGKGDPVQETTESGRPKRAVRKSVRISEGA